MQPRSIFTEFVGALEVPHTRRYSDHAFATMSFMSVFGLSKLLQQYGIGSETLRLSDPHNTLDRLPVPFLAGYNGAFVVVRSVGDGSVVLSDGSGKGAVATSRGDFEKGFNGLVMLASPAGDAAEPDYGKHHFLEIASSVKKVLLTLCASFLLIYLYVSNGIWHSLSASIMVLLSLAGIYISYLLVLKSSGIDASAGESICGVIARTGCNTVLKSDASTFFGLFGWAEVGLAYFSVNLCTLLVFPQYTGYLALVNAVCCPFSFWSVWYQKYRAKAWCTLCLIVQSLLWVGVAVYLIGGWFSHIGRIDVHMLVLLASYAAVLLASDRIVSVFGNDDKNDEK